MFKIKILKYGRRIYIEHLISYVDTRYPIPLYFCVLSWVKCIALCWAPCTHRYPLFHSKYWYPSFSRSGKRIRKTEAKVCCFFLILLFSSLCFKLSLTILRVKHFSKSDLNLCLKPEPRKDSVLRSAGTNFSNPVREQHELR